MSAVEIISRLDGVKRTGDRSWIARCPAHEDGKPSLSIREIEDGRTLLHCFGGCATADVVDAAGIGWGDLFPVRSRADSGRKRHREPLVRGADVVAALRGELYVAAVLLSDVAHGNPHSEHDRGRARTAIENIGRFLGALDHAE